MSHQFLQPDCNNKKYLSVTNIGTLIIFHMLLLPVLEYMNKTSIITSVCHVNEELALYCDEYY